MIGETFGSYRVTGRIGSGGMGAVYLAEHTLLGRKAAVKVLLPEHSQSQDLIDRFFNEAKTTASLKHPALVDVFDYGIHPSGSAYLVMDFLEGETLGSRLARVAPLSNEAAIDLGRQIARGMEAAHSRGIVHRDLKPDNIFLVPDVEDANRDQVKILDFGIAKLLGSPKGSKGATSTGMVLGTPLFMAPEQCKGAGVVDHRADIYSLGCILYFMLCARPPFDYPGVGEILGAHLHEAVTPPSTINPAVTPALEAIVMKTLAKKPEDRHQSMAALAADLARLLGQTGAARPMTFPPATVALPTIALPAAPAPTSLPAAPAGNTLLAAPAPTTLSTAASQVPVAAVPPAPQPAKRSLTVPLVIAFGAGVALTAVAVFWPRARVAPPVAVTKQPPPVETPPVAATKPVVATPPVAAAKEPPVVETPPAKPIATSTPTTTADAGAAVAATKEPKPEARPVHREGPDGYTRGIAFLARGEEREALESFRSYLRGSGQPAARRAEAERYMLDLQRKFGEIEVSCDLVGADVLVDGRSYGRTPLARSILLNAGAHELVVSKSGYNTFRKSFTLSPGQRQPFFFRLPR
jgi:serine/threonine-protein kinase